MVRSTQNNIEQPYRNFLCFILFYCRELENMLETPIQSLATTNSKCQCLSNDRCFAVVTKVVVWATWKTRDYYLQAIVIKYSSIYHLLLWNVPEIKYINGNLGWCDTGWLNIKLCDFSKGINHGCSYLCLCCYCFENPCSTSLCAIYST